jgi:hypothetical protein
MDRGRAPDVPCRPRQAWEGRLARHFPTLCHDTDTDAGGQPCSEVLPEAEQPHSKEEEVQPLWCGNWSDEFYDQFTFCSTAVSLPVINTLCRLKVPTRQHSAGQHQYPSCNSPACRRWPSTQGRRRELCRCHHAWTWWWAAHHSVLVVVVVVVMHHRHRTHLPSTWWQSRIRHNSRCLIWSWRCRHPGYLNSLVVPPGERLFLELSELPDLLLSSVLIKKKDGNRKLASRR